MANVKVIWTAEDSVKIVCQCGNEVILSVDGEVTCDVCHKVYALVMTTRIYEVNAQETQQVSQKELRAAISDLAKNLHAFTVGEFVKLSSDELAALATATKVLDTIVIRM